jgi:hypothetical protein
VVIKTMRRSAASADAAQVVLPTFVGMDSRWSFEVVVVVVVKLCRRRRNKMLMSVKNMMSADRRSSTMPDRRRMDGCGCRRSPAACPRHTGEDLARELLAKVNRQVWTFSVDGRGRCL